jgi:hypothetical protein
MALIRVLLNKLALEGNKNPAFATKLEDILSSKPIGIKLIPQKAKKGDSTKKTRSFSERVQKSSLKRPELIRILKEQDLVLEVLSEIKRPANSKQTSEQVAQDVRPFSS